VNGYDDGGLGVAAKFAERVKARHDEQRGVFTVESEELVLRNR
jgi:hypothetical protein